MQNSKLIIVVSFLFCFFYAGKAQTVSGVVLDKETGEPIPYASVYLSSFKSGIYASEKGLFELKYDSPNDAIIVSVIGYVSYQNKMANLQSTGNMIYLEPNTINLEEIVVIPSTEKKETIWLGALNTRNKRWNGAVADIKTDGSFAFNVEDYLFVNGINVPVRIKKVVVGCSKEEEKLEALFRIRFYAKDIETNEPAQIVNKKDIVKGFIRTKSKTITFDIENENLIFPPEGLFVSVEHIGYILNEQVDDSLLNKYNLLTPKKANREISIAYVKSREGAIAGVKFQGMYYLPIEGNENFYQMEKQKYNVFIQLEVEKP